MAINKPNNGLETQITRDASIRAYELIFIDPRIDFGGKVLVTDRWLREHNLSLERDGMIYHTLMALYAAFWTGTTEEAGLLYTRKTYELIDGEDIC